MPIEGFDHSADEKQREHVESNMEEAQMQEHGREDAPLLPGCLNIRGLLSARL
jgi:hypothetical protein